MQEQLLHRIWQSKHFNHTDLCVSNGDSLKIIQYGYYNTNAGPDFQNGHILINGQSWYGHIELHIKSSDWDNHRHYDDPAYNNVILHVVFEDDRVVYTESGRKLPTLILKDRVDAQVLERYDKINNSLNRIPCSSLLHSVNKDKVGLFLHRLLIERLERKVNELNSSLIELKNDWETILFKWLLKYACPKSNKEAFDQLGDKIPLKLIYAYRSNLFQLEALMLGQSGMLQAVDDYTSRLVREYTHLKNKYKLSSMTGVEWRFSRMRPAQFPTLRIVQMAYLYHRIPRLFQTLLTSPVHTWRELFEVDTSEYWKTHYIPGKKSVYKRKTWGVLMIDNILINVIIPLIYVYGKKSGAQSLTEKAIELIYTFRPENNNIIRLWGDAGIIAKNAGQTQALIQLKSEYCNQYLCMYCSIGQELLFK